MMKKIFLILLAIGLSQSVSFAQIGTDLEFSQIVNLQASANVNSPTMVVPSGKIWKLTGFALNTGSSANASLFLQVDGFLVYLHTYNSAQGQVRAELPLFFKENQVIILNGFSGTGSFGATGFVSFVEYTVVP